MSFGGSGGHFFNKQPIAAVVFDHERIGQLGTAARGDITEALRDEMVLVGPKQFAMGADSDEPPARAPARRQPNGCGMKGLARDQRDSLNIPWRGKPAWDRKR